MGLIINRSIVLSALTYLGVVIGYINVLWLYPKAFQVEELGLFRLVQDTALLLVPFTQLGAGQSFLKYYPQASTARQRNQLLGTSILWSGIGLVLAAAFYWVIGPLISSYLLQTNPYFERALPLVFTLLIILNLQSALEYAGRAYLRFRFIAFVKDVLIRLLSGALVALYLLQYISYGQVLYGLIAVFGLGFLAITSFLLIKIELRLGWFLEGFNLGRMPRSFYTYGLITLLSAAGATLVMRSDSFMVGLLGGNAMNGIYTTAFYMAVVIEIPKRTIAYVSVPMISQAFEDRDIRTINGIYQKASINLLLLSGLMLAGIVCNLQNLYSFMPKGEIFALGAPVVMVIGLSKLLDMAAGLNTEILVLSPYYRANLYLTLLLGIMNVALNYLLIPVYGMLGAAYASLASVLVFNSLKYVFIRKKLKIQPFTLATFKALVILLPVLGLGLGLPRLELTLADLFYRSASMSLLFYIGLIWLKPSDDLEKLRISFLNRLGF